DAMSEDTPVPRGRSRDQAPKPAVKRDSSKLLLVAGGGAALVLLIVAIVLLVTRDRHKSAAPPGGNGQVKASPSPSPSTESSDGNQQIEDDENKKKKKSENVEPPPVWPPLLYRPKEPLDVKKLSAEFLEATPPLPKDTLEFHVSRLPASGKVAKNVKRFDSLS